MLQVSRGDLILPCQEGASLLCSAETFIFRYEFFFFLSERERVQKNVRNNILITLRSRRTDQPVKKSKAVILKHCAFGLPSAVFDA